MDQMVLEKMLADLPMGGIRFYQSVDSTNDIAARWVERGADDFSLVIADAQTSGRGRSGRKWFTYPGSGLALSLILRPSNDKQENDISHIGRVTGLGALAVCQVIQEKYSLPARVKWPNDVLISNRKCCGVLVENQWLGDKILSVILGIGVNICVNALPPADDLRTPATSVALALAEPVDRIEFLRHLLEKIQYWRSRLMEDDFHQTWESNLAFLGKPVEVVAVGGSVVHDKWQVIGQITGLDNDGGLKLRTTSGKDLVLYYGEINDRHPRSFGKNDIRTNPEGEFYLRPVEEDFDE